MRGHQPPNWLLTHLHHFSADLPSHRPRAFDPIQRSRPAVMLSRNNLFYVPPTDFKIRCGTHLMHAVTYPRVGVTAPRA
jgi:hypothetical protein